MPHFNNGTYAQQFEFQASPRGFWRRNVRLWKWYLLPFFPGQRVDFDLRIRRLPNTDATKQRVHLQRYQVENTHPTEQILELTNEWVSFPIFGTEASGLGAVEYRFGQTNEYESRIVVSVTGTDSTSITFLLTGVILGALFGLICSAIFWIIQYLLPQIIWVTPST